MVAALAFVSAVLLPLLVPVAVDAVLPPLLVPVAVVSAVLPPLLVPELVAAVILPAFVEGPGVCLGPAPIPPPQYGAQGLLSVGKDPPDSVAEAMTAMRRC